MFRGLVLILYVVLHAFEGAGARLCHTWARGPAHVAYARGQYRYLTAVHTASALVSGLSLTWYYELRLTIRQNITNNFGNEMN